MQLEYIWTFVESQNVKCGGMKRREGDPNISPRVTIFSSPRVGILEDACYYEKVSVGLIQILFIGWPVDAGSKDHAERP
jgi:hypothetical protein